ncbi:hypothetical protein BJX64DRAFT_291897 [Aspergillus heterothallicus]
MATPPCARCVRLELDCTVEPRSRRSTQRDRVRQLEDHVMQLRQSLGGGTTACLDALPTASASSQTVESAPAAIPDLANVVESVSDFSEPYRLDSIVLQVRDAAELFKIFFRDFHPILPFLNSNSPPADCHHSCPLLFWSIVSVAARRYDTDPTLLTRLTSPLDELLHASVREGIKSLPQIQALVLLGYWPLFNHRFWDSNTLLYCNTALTSALQLDLHRPGYGQEYSFLQRIYPSHVSVGERNRTWIATVLLSFSVTRGLGLPPIVPLMQDLSPEMLLDTPDVWRQLYKIQQASHRIVSSLSQIELGEGLYTKLSELEKEAMHVEDQMTQEMTLTNSLLLIYSKLYVQCMFFLLPAAGLEKLPEKQRQLRTAGVLRAYATAVSVIMLALSHDKSFDELHIAPSQVPYILFVSALVVFRVLHSSFACLVSPTTGLGISEPTRDRGQALCGMACFTIQRCSLQRGDDRDLPARMIDILRKLWRAADRDPHFCSKEPVVRVNSRMGAGIIFDCIDIWRRRYNKGDGRPQPPRTAEGGMNVDGNIGQTQPLLGEGTHATDGTLSAQILPDGSAPTYPTDWENIDWTFSDMLGESSDDWSLGSLL